MVAAVTAIRPLPVRVTGCWFRHKIRLPALAAGRWRGRLLSVAAAMLIYVVNTVFMTAVQVGGAAVALALA